MTLASGTEASLLTDVAFWVISISTIVAAIAVVQLKDLFRAALFLIVCLVGVAGLFILLRAAFLAAVQILLYVGAISILIVFAIVMTRDVDQGSPDNLIRVPAVVLAALFFGATSFVALQTEWNLIGTAIERPELATAAEAIRLASTDVYSNTIPVIGTLLVRDFVLAFEVASVLLLAAVVGALALLRGR